MRTIKNALKTILPHTRESASSPSNIPSGIFARGTSSGSNPSVPLRKAERGNFNATLNSPLNTTPAHDKRQLKNRAQGAPHKIVFVTKQDSTIARRLLQRQLKERAKDLRVLYADTPAVLKNLEKDVRMPEPDKTEIIDGPFGELLREGGTLIVNACDLRHKGQFAALNTLMEEQTWKGKPIPCTAQGKKVEVIFLCDENMLRVLSGAEFSRVSENFDHVVPVPDGRNLADLKPQQPKETYPDGTKIADLRRDPNWRWLLFGGPKQNENKQWVQAEGEISDPDFTHPVVVRNPPDDDPLLMDYLVDLREDKKDVRLEKGLPQSEIEPNLARKKSAEEELAELRKSDDPLQAPVCIVNNENISQVLQPQDTFGNGQIVRRPSFLDQTRNQFQKTPIVYVTEELHPDLWDDLMQHPGEFSIAAAPGVEIPPQYEGHIFAIPVEGPQRYPWPGDIKHEHIKSPVNFIFSADPGLTEKDLLTDGAKRLDVTPLTRSDELLYGWKIDEDKASSGTENAGTGNLPCYRLHLNQLIQDLEEGTDVVLRGLNPELAQHLATLLHPPHYLEVDGKRLHYKKDGSGDLKGRLLVLTSDKALLTEHLRFPIYVDAKAQKNWPGLVFEHLTKAFPDHTADDIRPKLKQLLNLLTVFRKQGFIQQVKTLASYPVVEKLFRILLAAPASSSADLDQIKTRQIKTLLKDKLIGEFRHDDERYKQLTLWLKVLFRDEEEGSNPMSWMPDKSMNEQRLKALLRADPDEKDATKPPVWRVQHPEDIKRNAWQFLNTFSPDIIKGIICDEKGEFKTGRKAMEEMRQDVLKLVYEQAQLHGLPLPPMIQQAADLPDESRKLESHTRKKLKHEQKTQALAELALAQSSKVHEGAEVAAVSMKGDPGTGKSHTMNKMKEDKSVYQLHIAEEGEKRFADVLQAWAEDPAKERPALLMVDEANLANPETFDMLRSVLTDGTLFVNGKRIKLSGKHEIVFTGNSDLLPGRSTQQVEKESFVTVPFKRIPKPILRRIFAAPLLDHAATTEKLSPILNESLKKQIADEALEIHTSLERVFLGLNLSPRNLEEYLAQVLCRLQKDGKPVDQKQLHSLLARTALNVYGSAMQKEDKQAVASWLQDRLALPPQAMRPFISTPDGKPDSAIELMSNGKPKSLIDLIKETELADTPSTRELFDKVNWWLDSQDMRDSFNHKPNSLGQPALLMEGPASRGKDKVIIEALKKRKNANGENFVEGRDFVHINADPNDVEGFLAKVREARRKGQVLVVSELNMLPSGILEGELNALLTGDADEPAKKGFRFIATNNPPEYAGREVLSPALRGSRMHLITVDDYKPHEFLPIAQRYSESLCETRTGSQVIRSLVKLSVDDDKLKELVSRHHALRKELEKKGYPSQFLPTIRQLRRAIERLDEDSDMKAEEAFNKSYCGYQFLAQPDNGLRLPDDWEDVPGPSLEEQLQTSLALSHPEWLSLPAFHKDRELAKRGSPIEYDQRRHCLRFDPACSMDKLRRALRDLTKDGLPYEDKKAQATSLAPMPSTSGVGEPEKSGTFGQAWKAGVYLERYTQRLGEKGDDNSLTFRDPALPNTTPMNKGESLKYSNIKFLPGEQPGEPRRIPLEAELGKRPTQVRLDGRLAEGEVHRYENGGTWYVHAFPETGDVVRDLKYGQADYQEEPMDLKAEKKIRLKLDGDLKLSKQIEQLKQERAQHNLDAHAVVKKLHGIFKKTFFYSDQHADAIKHALKTGGIRAMCQHLVDNKHDICFGIANTFAAILEQEFEIGTAVSSGHVPDRNRNIDKTGHSWVKYSVNGKLYKVDPTVDIPRPNDAGFDPARAIQDLDDIPDDISMSGSEREDDDPDTSDSPEVLSGDDKFRQYQLELKIDEEVIAQMSLSKIGYRQDILRRGGDEFANDPGTLVPQRVLMRELEVYRRKVTERKAQNRAVYLGAMPEFPGKEEAKNFISRINRPLQALLNNGTPVFIRNEQGNFVAIKHGFELQNYCHPTGPTTVKPSGDDKLVLQSARQSETFFKKLEAHFYDSLLDHHQIQRNNKEAVKRRIISELFHSDEGRCLTFPIIIDLRDGPVEVTIDEIYKIEIAMQDKIEREDDDDEEIADLRAVRKTKDFLDLYEERYQNATQSEALRNRLINKIRKTVEGRKENICFTEKIRLILRFLNMGISTSEQWNIDCRQALSQTLSPHEPRPPSLSDSSSLFDNSYEDMVGDIVRMIEKLRHDKKSFNEKTAKAWLDTFESFPDNCMNKSLLADGRTQDKIRDVFRELMYFSIEQGQQFFFAKLKSEFDRIGILLLLDDRQVTGAQGHAWAG